MEEAAPRAAAPSAGRDPALEVLRGLAILEVVVHHVSGNARLHLEAASLTNLFYAVLNRSLHFAVPVFLFAMAVVLTRSVVVGGRTWSVFYRRRVTQTLVPYLIWTAIYLIYRIQMGRMTGDALLDPGRWTTWLLWGKAWEHLYFMSLALQLYLLLPLLIAFFGRLLRNLWIVIPVGVSMQLGFVLLNSRFMHLPYPAATLPWHLTAVGTGVWLGANYDRWPELRRRVLPLAVAGTVTGLVLYLPQGLRELRGEHNDTIAYLLSYWLYTVSAAFALLGLAGWLSRRMPRLAKGLQLLGVQSIQIYLIHPMLLYLWYLQPKGGTLLAYNIEVLAVALGAVAASLLLAWVARRLQISNLLFGRSDIKTAPLPSTGGSEVAKLGGADVEKLGGP